MEEYFSDAERAGVTMYLLLFALIVLGTIAAFMKRFRVFGVAVLCGSVGLLVGLATGVFP